MNETERKGVGRAGLTILILSIVVVILTMSNLMFYFSLQSQIGTLKADKENLQTERSSLLSQVNSLKADKYDLQREMNNLQIENDDLEDEVDDLQSEIHDLEREIEWLMQIAEEDNFQFYYASLAKQRFGVDDLEEYLDRWEWTEGSYVEGVFDCSEMSAYIEWKLENEGYHTYIVCGDSPWGDGYHAWLLVEASEEGYMPVEATQFGLIKWSHTYFDNYFEYDEIFETIQEALDYNSQDFDWWKS